MTLLIRYIIVLAYLINVGFILATMLRKNDDLIILYENNHKFLKIHYLKKQQRTELDYFNNSREDVAGLSQFTNISNGIMFGFDLLF